MPRKNIFKNLLSLKHIHKMKNDDKNSAKSVSASEFSGRECKIENENEEGGHNKPISPQKT